MLRQTFLWLSRHDGVFSFVKHNPLARRAASRFVAGETVESAIAAARTLNGRAITATLDLLGESVSRAEEARTARDDVMRTVEAIADAGVQAHVSVKLTQLGLDIDYALCAENMRTILRQSAARGIFVRIDMESSAYTERTLRLFGEELHPEFGDGVGVVVQAYLRRSEQDVDDLIGRGARVRLCKGAYAEPESVAFQTRQEVSESFVRLMRKLLARGNYPAIATHDDAMIRDALAFLAAQRIPVERFEFQMLYGVRRDLQDRLREDSFNVRVYIPFGSHWYPYLMRRLAERPANIAFMAGSVVKERFGRR